jgi:hypothetical protein
MQARLLSQIQGLQWPDHSFGSTISHYNLHSR